MRNKGQLTKDKIIKVSTKLFLEKGFHDLTFSQIAKKVSVSQPALYKYFDDKVNLLAECCLTAAKRGKEFIQKQIDPMDLPLEQIKSYIAANLNWFNNNRAEAYSLLSMYYFSESSSAINAIKTEIEKNGLKTISVLVRQNIQNSSYDIEEIQKTAGIIHSLMVGEIFKQFYDSSPENIASRIVNLQKTVVKLLNS